MSINNVLKKLSSNKNIIIIAITLLLLLIIVCIIVIYNKNSKNIIDHFVTNTATTAIYSTGESGTWIAPAGITQAIFTVIGGKGGNSITRNSGFGTLITVTVPVTSGETYNIYVGTNGENGTNTGGGNGGFDPGPNNNYRGGNGSITCGGGGAASYISKTSSGVSIPIVIAAGGGGASNGDYSSFGKDADSDDNNFQDNTNGVDGDNNSGPNYYSGGGGGGVPGGILGNNKNIGGGGGRSYCLTSCLKTIHARFSPSVKIEWSNTPDTTQPTTTQPTTTQPTTTQPTTTQPTTTPPATTRPANTIITSYTEGMSVTFIVPYNIKQVNNVSQVKFTVIGGKGGHSINQFINNGTPGGFGTVVTTTLSVIPDETYNIYVGNNGKLGAHPFVGGEFGYGGISSDSNNTYGGGNCGPRFTVTSGAGGGGAASYISKTSDSSPISNPINIIIAGGGGGGGGPSGNSGDIPVGGGNGRGQIDSNSSTTKGANGNNYGSGGGGGGIPGGNSGGTAGGGEGGGSYAIPTGINTTFGTDISGRPSIEIEYIIDPSITRAPTTTFALPTTTLALPTTTLALPTTTFTSPTTTLASPTTTFTLPTTTFALPTTTLALPTTTFGAPTTTFGAPTTTFGSPTTTFGSPTTTFGSPTTTFGSPTTTLAPTRQIIVSYIQCQQILFNIPFNSEINSILIIDENNNNVINRIPNYNTLSSIYNLPNINFFAVDKQIDGKQIQYDSYKYNINCSIQNINNKYVIKCNDNTQDQIINMDNMLIPVLIPVNTSINPTISSPTISSPTISSPTISSPTISSPTISSPISSSLNLVYANNTSNTNLSNVSSIFIFTNNPTNLENSIISLSMFDSNDLVNWIIPYTTDKFIKLNIPPATISPFNNINNQKIEKFENGQTIVLPNYINIAKIKTNIINYQLPSPSTTFALPSTTFGSLSTTFASPSTTSPNLIDLTAFFKSKFPNITPEQLAKLINSSNNINNLLPIINNNGTIISDKGIKINSKYRGPSTNILQKDYKGATNVYSPFLYYNKGTSEQFSSVNANDVKNKTNDYYTF